MQRQQIIVGVNSTVTTSMDRMNQSMSLSGRMVGCKYFGYLTECYSCKYEAQLEHYWG